MYKAKVVDVANPSLLEAGSTFELVEPASSRLILLLIKENLLLNSFCLKKGFYYTFKRLEYKR
jgi:hypothetical protein